MPNRHRDLFANLPGFTGTTYAAWPVWSDSTREEVRFQPMPKKAAVKLWHRARDFDRQTKRPGRHGGAVGHSALQVLHALIFDFMNYASGRLDPSYTAIAKAANVCERTVATAIQRLKDLRILNWLRRCREERTEEGGFALKQETNAYAVLPSSQWQGYREPPEAPPPAPGTWGDHPPLPDALALAVLETDPATKRRVLEVNASSDLERALALLGRAIP